MSADDIDVQNAAIDKYYHLSIWLTASNRLDELLRSLRIKTTENRKKDGTDEIYISISECNFCSFMYETVKANTITVTLSFARLTLTNTLIIWVRSEFKD